MEGKTIMFTIASVALLAGCGTQSSVTSNKQVTTAIKGLPTTVQTQLSSYKAREHTVHALPIEVQGTPLNVLYISPTEQFAITQFAQVWSRLNEKPLVVWTGTTQAQAVAVWEKEGYKSDPLQSSQTEYTQKVIPTPDAYHSMKKSWMEVPGVLPPLEVGKWVEFFQ